MLLAALFVLALASVPLLGGRLSALGELALRRRGYLLASLAVQAIALRLPVGIPEALPRAGHLASYALLAAFVWGNRRVPGLRAAALGGGLNLLAIAANGGVMPASPKALATAGMPSTVAGFTNSEVLADPRLPWLGDVLALPAELPLATAFSVGDLVLVAGVAYGLHAVCGSRPAAALRRRRAAAAW